MRNSKLTFLCAVFGPLLLATGACFLTTGSDEYDEYGTGGGGCQVGAPGCPCTGSGACDDGLTCVAMLNTCVVDNDCTGAPGCNCTPQGEACDPGFICKEGYCVSEAPCNDANIGAEGCQCTMGGGCDDGLQCLSNTCVDPNSGTTSTSTTDDPSTSTTTTTTTTATTDDSMSETTPDESSSSGGGSSSSSGGSVDESGTAGSAPTSG